jgi:hypothetical protein
VEKGAESRVLKERAISSGEMSNNMQKYYALRTKGK